MALVDKNIESADWISGAEEVLADVFASSLASYTPNPSSPLTVGLYGGEFGAEDVYERLEALVQRGPTALLEFAGDEDTDRDTEDDTISIQAEWGLYIAARNLRSESEQRRDAYPFVVGAKRLLRQSDTMVYSGSLGGEEWTAMIQKCLPMRSDIITSIPGYVCVQVMFRTPVVLHWGSRLTSIEIQNA